MGAILADATNLGLGRMAESSRGVTLPRLRWTAEWHVRDETYLSALAAIIDCHTAHPLAAVWRPGDTSSSDGQFFRAGGYGEACADCNARYGTEPGVLFYTHVTDRFTPFHTKVIAANAGEAAHVLDGLLDHESELVIREHATDTAGAVDHVFGLCHLLGFRFAPRIRDLNERQLYGLSPLDPWPTLRPLVAGRSTSGRSRRTGTKPCALPPRSAPAPSAPRSCCASWRFPASEPGRARAAGERADRAHPVHARLVR